MPFFSHCCWYQPSVMGITYAMLSFDRKSNAYLDNGAETLL